LKHADDSLAGGEQRLLETFDVPNRSSSSLVTGRLVRPVADEASPGGGGLLLVMLEAHSLQGGGSGASMHRKWDRSRRRAGATPPTAPETSKVETRLRFA